MRKRVLSLVILLIFIVSAFAFAQSFKTVKDLLAEARQVVKEITVDEAYKDYFKPRKKDVVFLDVREKEEVEAGHIPGAKWIPRGLLEFKIEKMFPNRDAQLILVYCKTGGRSLLAAETLTKMGYKVISIKGGFTDWAKKKYPVKKGEISSEGGGCS